MFDLKMCFLDLMRITTNGTRQKKPLKEMSTRNYPHYAHHRFSDTNTIYFNENMSMTSRSNTIRFSRCPTGNFNPNACSRSSRQPPLYEWIDPINGVKPPISASPIGGSGGGGGGGGEGCIGSSGGQHTHNPTIGATYNRFTLSNNHNQRRLPNIPIPNIVTNQHQLTAAGDQFFDSSSDERLASSTVEHTMSSLSDSSMRETETDDCICSYSDCGQTMLDEQSVAGLDSFCTLCTSSFSFNRCNQCEESSCGSKCEIIDDKKLIDCIEDTSGGGESSGNVSSDCESVKFR